MSKAKKLVLILSAVIFSICTSCKNIINTKNGKIAFDFSGLANKTTGSSRSIIDEILQEGKDCFIDLSLEGTFTYKDTFNLKETTSYTIDDIPVGSQVKAVVQVYTYNDSDDPTSKEILFLGQSKKYVIQRGITQIVIHLTKDQTQLEINTEEDPNNNGGGSGNSGQQQQEDSKITIWVKYDSTCPKSFWNDTENKSNENEANDGKTYNTAFNYIQSAVNWIAENGDGNKDYEIMLTDYDETHAFDQDVLATPRDAQHPYEVTVIFGKMDADADNLNGKANSITLTSNKPTITAIKANHSMDNILIRTSVTLYIKNIKIETEHHSRILDTIKSSGANVFLKNIIFSDITDPEVMSWAGSSAIYVEGGTVTMQDNSTIENFYASNGGAVYIDYGDFIMEDNSKIENCKVTQLGGAVYLHSDALYQSFTIKDNAKINKCTASYDGGAICQKGGKVYIEGGSITECKANSQGGAIKMDGSSANITLYLKGGTIKDNEAGDEGDAFYITKGLNSTHTVSLIMSDNACVDLSNDIYTYGIPIQLGNTLTTTKEKAALITFGNTNIDQTVITSGDTEAVSNSYTKFYAVNSSLGVDCYIDEDGVLKKFDTDADFLKPGDTVQVGDIVFADNKSIRGQNFYTLSQNLRSQIAGIVFYAKPDLDPIITSNLIVGTNTYSGEMSTSRHGASGFTMFDRYSSVKDSTSEEENFPGASSRTGSYNEIRDTTTAVAFANAIINSPTNSGNQSLNEGFDWDEEYITYNYHNKVTFKAVQEIMQKINNNQTCSYPLYQKIFEHGKNFDNTSKYKLNTDDSNITDNWYIPTIAELKLFYDAMQDPTFSDIYVKLCGNLKQSNYYSESVVISSGAQYPDMYRYKSGSNEYYYAYYYTIKFNSGLIKCDPSNQSLYAIPVHVYVPVEE